MNSASDFFNDFASKSEEEQKKTALNMLSGMSTEQSGQIRSILGDKEKVRQILSSPQAQQLMQKLKGGGNGQHK